MARSDDLKHLQEELLQLKQQVPGLHLKKSTAAQSPAAPFPITAHAEVAAAEGDAAAQRYDVDAFTLQVRLLDGVAAAGGARAPPASQAEQTAAAKQQLEAAVQVEVLSRELPAALREAMAAALHRQWVASNPAPGRLNLALLWATARQQFVHLLTLLPQLLESYQSADSSGGTVRRWAVLNDQTTVTIDASVHPAPLAAARKLAVAAAAAAAGTPLAGAAAAAGGSRRSVAVPGGTASTARRQPPSRPHQPHPLAAGPAAAGAAGPAAEAGALPRGLQQELDFLQRRYGLRLLPPEPAAPAAAPAAGADAAAQQLAGMQLAPPAAAAHRVLTAAAGSAAAAADMHFELLLLPTDPAWDASQRLLLHCRLKNSSSGSSSGYPQAGSLAVTASIEQQQLPLLQQQVLDKLLAAEVAAAAGRPGALRAVVRYLENHGGQLMHQAEDIAAEVARRRQQQQQGAQQAAAAVSETAAVAARSTQAGHGGAQAPRRRRQPAAASDPGIAAAAAAEPVAVGDGGGSGGSSSSSGSVSEYDDDGAMGGYYYSSSSGGSSGGGSSAGAGSSDNDEDALSEAGAGGKQLAGQQAGGGHSDAVLPLLLQLEGLQLVDCDALELLRLNLQVACTRCKASGDLTFATSAVALPSDGGGGSSTLSAAAECATCHAAWEVQVAPKLMHGHSSVLAHIRAEGCTPLDLLPSMLAGQCGQCASSAAFRSVAVGRWNERACSACHAPMRFQFTTAMFVPHLHGGRQQRNGAGGGGGSGSQQQTRGGRGGAGSSSAADAVFNGLLQLGQPLPERGTCPHYRHSYRWLRFPCCGKRFPCDLCHEELTDGHDMRWATRMACGYCSLEQPVAPRCKGCDKKLAATASAPSGRHTKFWEGGKGQRDPSKLHKGDPRRYRSKQKKTRSNKSRRVGQEGKERRQRGERQRAE